MLEVIRRNGSKSLSHLLAAHSGQIYMHSLSIGRSLHEDPPSISEGAGGRVTDYRITVRFRLIFKKYLTLLSLHIYIYTTI